MANVITGTRIVCALTMMLCPTFSVWFYVLYAVCGISDVLDGIVARHFGKETKFGAQLDTIADIVFVLILIIKIARAISIPMWLIIWIICIAILKAINIISGFVIYKHFVFEHTVMNKICGVLLFLFPLCIRQMSLRPVLMLIIFICCFATIAAVQEGHYIHTGKIIR